MKAKYEYNLFDLDGTLTNPQPGITGSVAYALEKFGITVDDRSSLNKFIGPPLFYSFKTYYGMSDAEAELAMKYYRERFSAGGLFENEIYDGIPGLLSDIRSGGGRVILATGKPEEFAIEILKYFDIYKYFDFVAVNTLDEKRPEKRQVITHIIKNRPLLSKNNAVMIGDRRFDMEAAAEFGLDSIGVLFGFGSREELSSAGACMLADSVSALHAMLVED